MGNTVTFQFTADTKSAEALVDAFVHRFKHGMSEVTDAVVAAFSFEKLFEMGKQAIETADEFDKLRQRVGSTTETLSAWAFGAHEAGLKTEDFNVGLRTFQRVLSDLKKDIPQAKEFFMGIGMQPGPFRNIEEAVSAVADRFGELEDGELKTDAALTFFGRSGERWIPLLNRGSEGFRSMAAHAHEAGAVIRGETAVAASEFTETLMTIHATFDGVAMSIVEKLLPDLQRFAETLQKQVQLLGQHKGAITGVVETMKGLALVVSGVVIWFNALGRQIGINLGVAWEQLADHVSTALRLFKALFDMVGELKTRIYELGFGFGSLGEVIGSLAKGDFAGAKAAASDFMAIAKDAATGVGSAVTDAVNKALGSVDGYLDRSKARVKNWADLSSDNVMTAWERVKGMFSTLFSTATTHPPAEGGASGSGGKTFVDTRLREETEKFLQSINDAYAQAAISKQNILERDYQEQLRLLGEKIKHDKRLNDEDLKNDEDYAIAKYQLDVTYARKRDELARLEREKKGANALSGLQNQFRSIENDPSLVDQAKRPALIENLQRQVEIIQTLRQTYVDLAADASQTDEARLDAGGKLLELDARRIELQQQLQELQSKDFTGTLRSGFVSLYNEWSSLGANLANGVIGGIRTAVDGLADAITGLITGTRTWGQVWQQVGLQVINMIVKIVLQWIVSQILALAVGKAVGAAWKTEAVAAASAWGAAATAASIATYGSAAAVGTAAYIGGLLTGQAFTVGAAAGGSAFEVGGPVRGGRQQITVNENGEEYVVRAPFATQFRQILDDINTGAYAARNRSVRVPVTSSSSSVQSEVPGIGGGGSGGSEVNVAPTPVHVVLVHSEEELMRVLESRQAGRVVVKHVRGNRGDAGFDT